MVGGVVVPVKDVWRHNLGKRRKPSTSDAEFAKLKLVAKSHPIVAVTTEFPGMVARPLNALEDYNYQCLRTNVDLLNPLTIALAFSAPGEDRPVGIWVFHLSFCLADEVYNKAWVDKLKAFNVDFDEYSLRGLRLRDLGDRLTTSDLMKTCTVTSYNMAHDLAFLVKAMSGNALPSTESDFRTLVHSFIPQFVDLRCLMVTVTNSTPPENVLSAAGALRLLTAGQPIAIVNAMVYARLAEIVGREPEVTHQVG